MVSIASPAKKLVSIASPDKKLVSKALPNHNSVNGALPNACIICGKQRIVISTSEEMVGNTLVTSTEMSCPDVECQKKLDKQLREERRKRESAKTPFGFNFKNKGQALPKTQKQA